MARRRYQNPKPIKEGNWWYLRLWQDAFDKGGNPVRKLKRIKLAEASTPARQVKKMADEIVRPINHGMITVGAAVNFAEYVKHTYLPTVLPLRPKPVCKVYRGLIDKHLQSAFGKLSLAEITPYSVQAFFSSLPARGVPFPTMVKIRDAFSHIMRSAVKYKHIPESPLKGLELPPDLRPVVDKTTIQPSEFQALVEMMPEPYATMVYVAVWTGLRVSELLALKWRNVLADSIKVEQRYCRGEWRKPKTHASAAYLAVDNAVLARIHRLKAMTVDVPAGRAVRRYKLTKADGPDDLVFQSVKDGKPMNDGNVLRRFIKPAADALKLSGVNWRCLRRSCATWMVQAGADPKSVQSQMRHSRISTTMEIYAQRLPEGQRRAVQQMQDYARRSIIASGTNAGTLAVQ